MKYHLSFHSEHFNILTGNEKMLAKIEEIKKNLYNIIGITLVYRLKKSVAHTEVDFAFVECDGELDDLLKAIDGKIDKLNAIGINEITMWGLYEYEAQCNMEFTPEQMLIMGKNNIHFCISCWEKADFKKLDISVD